MWSFLTTLQKNALLIEVEDDERAYALVEHMSVKISAECVSMISVILGTSKSFCWLARSNNTDRISSENLDAKHNINAWPSNSSKGSLCWRVFFLQNSYSEIKAL